MPHWSASPRFEAANLLETALIYAQSGAIPFGDFVARLLSSQVFVLLDKDPGPSGVWDNTASPLMLRGQAGLPMMAIFTAPERSTGWPARIPEYSFGLLTDFRWLLKGTTSSVGLVINPGSTVGVEMPASDVAQLRADAEQ